MQRRSLEHDAQIFTKHNNIDYSTKNLISVILPTYNEKGNITKVLDAVLIHTGTLKAELQVIVVDDNSPDDTGHYVKQLYKDHNSICTIIRKKSRGLASAIYSGVMHARGNIVVVLDADYNHDPAVIPTMVTHLTRYDLVAGSRFLPGGGMDNLARYYGSWAYNGLIKAVLGTNSTDHLSGFFAMRADKLHLLDHEKIFWGYGDYFLRLLFYAQQRNFNILEVPIRYQKRQYGKSKTRFPTTLLHYTRALAALRSKNFMV